MAEVARRTVLHGLGAAGLGITSTGLPGATAAASTGGLPGGDVLYLDPTGTPTDPTFDVVITASGGDGPPAANSRGYLFTAGTDGYVNRVTMIGGEADAEEGDVTSVQFFAATDVGGQPGVGALLGTIPYERRTQLSSTVFHYWETSPTPVEIPAGDFWVMIAMDAGEPNPFSVRKSSAATANSDVSPQWSVKVDGEGRVFHWNLAGNVAVQTPGPFYAELRFVSTLT